MKIASPSNPINQLDLCAPADLATVKHTVRSEANTVEFIRNTERMPVELVKRRIT